MNEIRCYLNEKRESLRPSRQPRNTSPNNNQKKNELFDNYKTYQNEVLDKRFNENYKKVNLKEAYTDSFIKKNNESYINTTLKSNISISRNTSMSKNPRNLSNFGVKKHFTKRNQKGNTSLEVNKQFKTCHSDEKKIFIKKGSFNMSNILNTSKYSVSSVNHYLERRHYETNEKITKMRSQKLNNNMELREKPHISKKSLVIAKKLRSSNVIKRLTCNSQVLKRNDELRLIERNNSNVKEVPKINDSNHIMTRRNDDLFNLKKKLDSKKDMKYDEQLDVNF